MFWGEITIQIIHLILGLFWKARQIFFFFPFWKAAHGSNKPINYKWFNHALDHRMDWLWLLDYTFRWFYDDPSITLTFWWVQWLSVRAHSVTKLCPALCDPMDCSPQALLSIGFFRQEYLSGLLFPSPGYLPDRRIKPVSPALTGKVLTTEPPGKPNYLYEWSKKLSKINKIFFLVNKLCLNK